MILSVPALLLRTPNKQGPGAKVEMVYKNDIQIIVLARLLVLARLKTQG
jgi:hypothetical protein